MGRLLFLSSAESDFITGQIAITLGDSQGTAVEGVGKRRAVLLHPSDPFLRLGLNGIKKSLGR